jgi:hypothetical protein
MGDGRHVMKLLGSLGDMFQINFVPKAIGVEMGLHCVIQYWANFFKHICFDLHVSNFYLGNKGLEY